MNKKSKLFLAGIIGVVANVIAVGSACFAWYTGIKARQNDAKGFAVTPADDVLIKDLKIIGFDTEEEKAKVFVKEGTDKPDYTLPAYDSIIFQKNQWNARFIRFVINYPAGIPTTDPTLKIKITCTGKYKKDIAEEGVFYVGNSLSNFVHFSYYDNKCGDGDIDSSDLTTDAGVLSCYSDCRTKFDTYTESDQHNFFHCDSSLVEMDTTSKTTEVSIEIPLDDVHVKTIDNALTSEIFLRFDYCDNLVLNYKKNCKKGGLFDIKIFSKEEEELLKIVSDIPNMSFSLNK